MIRSDDPEILVRRLLPCPHMNHRNLRIGQINEDKKIANIGIGRGEIFLPDFYSEELPRLSELHDLAVRELDVDVFLAREDPRKVADVCSLVLTGETDIAVRAVPVVEHSRVFEDTSRYYQRVVVENRTYVIEPTE